MTANTPDNIPRVAELTLPKQIIGMINGKRRQEKNIFELPVFFSKNGQRQINKTNKFEKPLNLRTSPAHKSAPCAFSPNSLIYHSGIDRYSKQLYALTRIAEKKTEIRKK